MILRILFPLFFLVSLHAEKVALIYGVAGQDGAYLTELLLRKGYTVHGVKRRSSSLNAQRIDPRYYRPAEVDYLHGDATKAKEKLAWEPKHSFEELIQIMVKHDMKEAKKELTVLLYSNS